MTIEPNDASVVETTDTDDLDLFTQEFYKSDEKEDIPGKTEKTETEAEDVAGEEVSEEDEGDEDSPEKDEKSDDPAPKKKNTFQDRVNQLLERERVANEKLAEVQRSLDELTAKQAETPKQPNPVVQQDQGPKPDDRNQDGSEKYPLGEYDPEYIRDLVRHTSDLEWNARKQKEEQEQGQRQIQEARDQLHNQWTERLAPVTEQHEDFLEKTLELESAFDGMNPEYSDYLVQTIKGLSHGPEVLYYFANHLDEAKAFVKMGPQAATLALGEYNSMFKGQTRKEAKVSNAPPPPQVNKGSNTRTKVAPDTDDLDAFEREFYGKKR